MRFKSEKTNGHCEKIDFGALGALLLIPSHTQEKKNIIKEILINPYIQKKHTAKPAPPTPQTYYTSKNSFPFSDGSCPRCGEVQISKHQVNCPVCLEQDTQKTPAIFNQHQPEEDSLHIPF